MRYVIYELVSPEILKKTELRGYDQHSIERGVLQKLDEYDISAEHPSFEAAVSEIEKNAELLKYKELTILPIISVIWNGEII